MGVVNSLINLKEQGSSKLKAVSVDLNIDFNRRLNPFINQLKGWSLQEIRQCYVKFREKYIENNNKSIFILLNQFCQLLPFSHSNSRFLFQQLTKISGGTYTQFVNVFEFICLLVLCSFSSIQNKVNMLYLLFDFNTSDSLTLEELTTITMCVIGAFCKITQQLPPSFNLIDKYSKIIFLTSDFNQDNQLSLKEIIRWVQEHAGAKAFFKSFDSKLSKINVQEDVHILAPFKKFSHQRGLELNNELRNYYKMKIEELQQCYQEQKKCLDSQFRYTNRSSKKTTANIFEKQKMAETQIKFQDRKLVQTIDNYENEGELKDKELDQIFGYQDLLDNCQEVTQNQLNKNKRHYRSISTTFTSFKKLGQQEKQPTEINFKKSNFLAKIHKKQEIIPVIQTKRKTLQGLLKPNITNIIKKNHVLKEMQDQLEENILNQNLDKSKNQKLPNIIIMV